MALAIQLARLKQYITGKTEVVGKTRLRIMMESGLLVDELATVTQNQIIAKEAGVALRSRKTIPLYHQTGEDQMGTWKENLTVETGEAIEPGMDSRNMLEDLPNFHRALRTATVQPPNSFALSNKMLAGGYIAVAGLIAIVSVYFSFIDKPPPRVTTTVATVATTPTVAPAATAVADTPTAPTTITAPAEVRTDGPIDQLAGIAPAAQDSPRTETSGSDLGSGSETATDAALGLDGAPGAASGTPVSNP